VRRIVAAIDGINGWIGRTIPWLVVAMVLIGALNAIARSLGRFVGVNHSSNSYLELQWYLFSLVFLLGAGYAVREDAHVRVDVMYARVSDRARSWINIVGGVLLLVPFCVFTLWVTAPAVRNSWRIYERSPDPGGLPRYPLKAVILVCFILVLLQGIAEIWKEIQALRSRGEPPHHDAPAVEGL
jgi:TRAP-type mannitol/chloroaromatic compound transport system permease small subunit